VNRLPTRIFHAKQFQFIHTNGMQNTNIDDLVNKLKNGHEDPYDLLARYVLYLQNKSNISPLTLKQWVVTVKNFLEYNDVDISPKEVPTEIEVA